MIFVVAFNHNQADYYCRFVADPPINPRNGKSVLILSTSDFPRAVRGRHITDDDTIVWYGLWYDGKYAMDVERALRPAIIGNPKEVHA